MYLRGKYWHYDFRINKKRYRGSTGFVKSEKRKAVNMIEQLKAGIREDTSAQIIIAILQKKESQKQKFPLIHQNIWKTFISTCNIRAGKHRKKMYSSRLRDFCSYMTANYPEIKNLDEIQSLHAKIYRNYLEQVRISNSTRNDHIAGLKLIFTHFVSLGYIQNNPFAEIKKFSSAKIKREAFTEEELQKILTKSGGWMYHVFLLTLCTGLREGDAALLKKSEIDKSLSWITIECTRKTGAKVDIPILPVLQKHLTEVLKKSSNSIYVYPELAEKYLTSPKSISREIKQFFRSLGIQDVSRSVNGYRTKVSVKDIHSFRQTFIYRAATENIPLTVILSIVGHNSPEMTRYYTEHAERKEKEIVREIFSEIEFPAKVTTKSVGKQEKSSL